MSVILDGRKLADKFNKETALDVKSFKHYRKLRHKSDQNLAPTILAILVGNDPASQMYVRMKQRKAERVGIRAYTEMLSSNITQELLDEHLEDVSHNDKFNAVLLQLPLPSHLNAHEAVSHISPDKDVDGVNPVNLGKLALGVNRHKTFYPVGCTPRGIMTLLYTDKWSNANLAKGLEATILGRSDIVGRPLALMLINAGAEVKVINSHAYHTNLVNSLKTSNLIVSATGHGHLIKSDEISPNAVLIDAGIDHDEHGKLIGDITPQAKGKSLGYTPVPGGVGPMTIAILMRQTVEMATNQAMKELDNMNL